MSPSEFAKTIFVAAIAAAMAFNGPANAADPKVVVTIKPVHSLVATIMQGTGELRLLIDGSASPHTFSMKPSDAKALNDADIFIRVSDGLEPFTSRLVKALPKRVRLVTLETVPGLTLHALRSGHTFEAHGHPGEKGHAGHSHANSAKAVDGHIWLDPANAKVITAHLAEVLSAAAPAHAARIAANAAALAQRLDDLSKSLETSLAPARSRPYIVFHDAYQYLERRYGLTPVGSVTVGPDVPPGARRLTELRRKIATLKATCVFAEPQFEPKVISAIIDGTTARQGLLDPLGAAIPAGPEQYFAMMSALANDLAACLGSPS